MGQIIVITNLTLDGVMQSPGHRYEDTRDGFEQGGWAAPYGAMSQPEAGAAFANMGGLLFGRWTYESFYSYWPKQTGNPFTGFLNEIPKYVVSSTLAEPLPWSNSVLLEADLPGSLQRLKQKLEQDLLVFGSGVLVQSLMQWNVVDEFHLLFHPLVLRSGRRLFEGAVPAKFGLSDVKMTANGVVVLAYRPVRTSP